VCEGLIAADSVHVVFVECNHKVSHCHHVYNYLLTQLCIRHDMQVLWPASLPKVRCLALVIMNGQHTESHRKYSQCLCVLF